MISPWDTIRRTSPAYQGKPHAPWSRFDTIKKNHLVLPFLTQLNLTVLHTFGRSGGHYVNCTVLSSELAVH
jgi:hypothetical protein